MEMINKEISEENSASLFSEEDSFEPKSDSDISDFESEKEEKSLAVYRIAGGGYRSEKQLKSFKVFVNRRKSYLEGLRNLENWISGFSEKPSEDSINYSKNVLERFKNWLYANEDIPIPKVIMGPIPRGGITLEFRPDSQNGMFISIYNDETLEVDVMVEETYHSVDLDQFNAGHYIREAYEYMVND